MVASSIGELWVTATSGSGQSARGALSWNNQYDSQPVYVSSGPVIRRFPCGLPGACQSRVWTLGAERFVTGRNLLPLNISVESEVGLKQVQIFDGDQLFRRFAGSDVQGRNSFHRTLLLPGEVQKNLVLVADDTNGGRAIGFAHRSWKDGQQAPIFCSDHVRV